ncbi:ADP-glucose phosphorylase-like protein [Drosera capensis]
MSLLRWQRGSGGALDIPGLPNWFGVVGCGDDEEGECDGLGLGFHDVVIEVPGHGVGLKDLEGREIGEVFKNHGASAGASLSHSHSQMISLPIVPTNAVVYPIYVPLEGNLEGFPFDQPYNPQTRRIF